MPANDGLWLDKDQRLFPSTPEPLQDYPEQSVRNCKSWLRTFFAQDRKLLPKRQVFQEQIPRERKSRVVETNRSLSRGNIPSVLHEDRPNRAHNLSA
jgi:hypothetical protein